MRYFHQGADKICDYVRSRGLVVAKRHYAQLNSTILVEAASITEMCKRSETLWGGSLIYYLAVSTEFEDARASLAEAVANVEASLVEDKFLVVTHQDGGIISVSGTLLPFQVYAEAAEWWRPYRYADCD